MNSKWTTNPRHHGTRHPELNLFYFDIDQIGELGSLSGYVSPAEFRRLAKRFGVSSKTVSAVSPALTAAPDSAVQL